MRARCSSLAAFVVVTFCAATVRSVAVAKEDMSQRAFKDNFSSVGTFLKLGEKAEQMDDTSAGAKTGKPSDENAKNAVTKADGNVIKTGLAGPSSGRTAGWWDWLNSRKDSGRNAGVDSWSDAALTQVTTAGPTTAKTQENSQEIDGKSEAVERWVKMRGRKEASSVVGQHPPPVGMPHGVRAASLVERLSAGIESVGTKLFDAVSAVSRNGDATERPRIHSVNETMIIAHIPATTLGENATKLAISHIYVIDGKLSVNLVASRPNTEDKHRKDVTIEFGENFPASVATVMKVGKPRLEKQSSTMTALYIPVKKMRLGHVRVRQAITENVFDPDLEKFSSVPHEGHIEEDGYEVCISVTDW